MMSTLSVETIFFPFGVSTVSVILYAAACGKTKVSARTNEYTSAIDFAGWKSIPNVTFLQ